MSARETGDSGSGNVHDARAGRNMDAVARLRGLRIDTTILLGLTPQALCCRPLSRAGWKKTSCSSRRKISVNRISANRHPTVTRQRLLITVMVTVGLLIVSS